MNHTICDLESAVQSPIREYAKEKRRSTLLRGIPKAIVTTRNRIRQKKEHLARNTKQETKRIHLSKPHSPVSVYPGNTKRNITFASHERQHKENHEKRTVWLPS